MGCIRVCACGRVCVCVHCTATVAAQCPLRTSQVHPAIDRVHCCAPPSRRKAPICIEHAVFCSSLTDKEIDTQPLLCVCSCRLSCVRVCARARVCVRACVTLHVLCVLSLFCVA